MRVLRGDFSNAAEFYALVPKRSLVFLVCARSAVIGAVGSGDIALFDTILKDIAAFSANYGTAESRLAVEIETLWIADFLHVSYSVPQWMDALDFSSFPPAYRHQAALLALERLVRCGEFRAAEALAESLLSLSPASVCALGSPSEVRVKFLRAQLCLNELRMEAAEHWTLEAVKSAAIHNVVLPFLGEAFGPKSIFERSLLSESPELLERLRQRGSDYLRQLVRFHNHHTGESITERLAPREFNLACALKRGLRYKEIAAHMGITYGHMKNMVAELYETLGICQSSELKGLVW